MSSPQDFEEIKENLKPNANYLYKSKYMTLVAETAPQKARNAATLTTAVVVPAQPTIEPMQRARRNCARKTILLTMATSVPSPLNLVTAFASPSLFSEMDTDCLIPPE